MQNSLKLFKNDVDTRKSNQRCVIAKFDTSDFWFGYFKMAWTGTQIEVYRKAAQMLGASSMEIKYEFTDLGDMVEPESQIITIADHEDSLKFFQELEAPEGTPRKFRYYAVEELLKR